MGDIWFLTPTVLYILLHLPGKEGGDLLVRYWLGTTVARNKMQIDLFYAFQGKKGSLGHIGAGLLAGFAVLQD